ncbi:MAG: hypothetical protein SNJ09_03770 [Rikenellaceae bacterium]
MLKTNFIAKSYRYIKYNPWSIKLVANKLFKVSLKSTTSNNFPQTIKVGDAEFKLINSVSELNIVNGGYWMRDVSTVDFVRDENFLRHRFFENFNKYGYTASKQRAERRSVISLLDPSMREIFSVCR